MKPITNAASIIQKGGVTVRHVSRNDGSLHGITTKTHCDVVFATQYGGKPDVGQIIAG
jgi:hypothetical protein